MIRRMPPGHPAEGGEDHPQQPARLLADVLVPEVGPKPDELLHQPDALRVVEHLQDGAP